MKTVTNNKKDLQRLEFYLNLIEIKYNLYIVSYKSWLKGYKKLIEHKDSDNEMIKMLMEKLANSLKQARVICIREENNNYEEALKVVDEYLGKSKSL